MATTPSRTGHLPINGLSLFHEVYGELGASRTSPLLLIPGALMATDSMTSWVSAFAPKRAVIVFDQQGHGRTADTSRTMSWEQFADDAAALLHALEVEHADVMGYSQADLLREIEELESESDFVPDSNSNSGSDSDDSDDPDGDGGAARVGPRDDRAEPPAAPTG